MKPSTVELSSSSRRMGAAAAAVAGRKFANKSTPSVSNRVFMITVILGLSLAAICISADVNEASAVSKGQKQQQQQQQQQQRIAEPSSDVAAATARSKRAESSKLEKSQVARKEGGGGGGGRGPSAGSNNNQQVVALESNIANAKVQVSPNDMATAAGSHHGKSHGKYYMYAEVPKKGAYKMGFKRGNHKHEIERKESVHKHHVHSYFKWHDKKGKGSHKFEFKHHEKKKHGHY